MPKRVNQQEKRHSIVEACWQVLGENGPDALSMRNIARAANCTTGLLTHYFDSREEIIEAAIHASYDKFKAWSDEIIARDLTALEKLYVIAEEILPLDEERLQEGRVWLTFWAIAISHADLEAASDAFYQGWYDDLAPLFREVNPSIDPHKEAQLFVALANGLLMQTTVSPSQANTEAALALFRDYIRTVADK